MRCHVCGNDDWDILGKKGDLVALRCKACGGEQDVFVSMIDDQAPIRAGREPVFKLVGRWSAQPKEKEVAEVRRQLPLMFWSADDLLEKGATRESFELGRFTLPELEMKLPVLKELGLELQTIPVGK